MYIIVIASIFSLSSCSFLWNSEIKTMLSFIKPATAPSTVNCPMEALSISTFLLTAFRRDSMMAEIGNKRNVGPCQGILRFELGISGNWSSTRVRRKDVWESSSAFMLENCLIPFFPHFSGLGKQSRWTSGKRWQIKYKHLVCYLLKFYQNKNKEIFWKV